MRRNSVSSCIRHPFMPAMLPKNHLRDFEVYESVGVQKANVEAERLYCLKQLPCFSRKRMLSRNSVDDVEEG
jgi:hypothetical protein